MINYLKIYYPKNKMDFDRFTSFISSLLLALLVLFTFFYIGSSIFNFLGIWWSLIAIGSFGRSYFLTASNLNR